MTDLTAGATARPWGVCELPWDDTGMNIYAPPGDPHGARLICTTDTSWLADDEDQGDVDQANAALVVRAVNAHDAAVRLADLVACPDCGSVAPRERNGGICKYAFHDALAEFRAALKP